MDLGEVFLVSLGGAVLLFCTWKLLGVTQQLFPKTWYPVPKSFFSSLGEWAVITGGSEGIGRAYAFELARHGLNIVIISRNLAKLETAAKEIGETTGKEVRVIVADFTKDDIYEHIEENLTGLNVGVLVNNVGIIPSHTLCKLLDIEDLEQRITSVINCNVKGLMKMCRIVLPRMEKRGKGLILNMSSGVAGVPCPLYTMYGASKVWQSPMPQAIYTWGSSLWWFSRSLQAEYKSKGIIIQAVIPFGVSTAMTNFHKPDMVTFTPEEFVKTSLDYVLVGDRTHGSISHQILGWILQAIPIQILHSEVMQEKLSEFVNKSVNGN